MKIITSRVAALAAILSCSLSIAAGTSAHLSWVAPTAYTDGTPLPASDIASYTITWAPAAGTSGPTGSTTAPAGALTATVNVPCGSTAFSVAVTTTSTARYPDVTSAPTAPVPYASALACVPNPPSGLVVQ